MIKIKIGWTNPQTQIDVWWALSRKVMASSIIIGIGATVIAQGLLKMLGHSLFLSEPSIMVIAGIGFFLIGLAYIGVSYRELKKSGELEKILEMWSNDEDTSTS